MADRKYSDRQIEMAMGEAQRLLTELAGEDEKLRRDTLEGQTNVFELMENIGDRVVGDHLLIERGKERIRRLEKRHDRQRGTLARMREVLGITETMEKPLHTLAMEFHTHVLITDETALDPEYIRPSPDKVAIGKALRAGTFRGKGAELSNPQPTIKVTSK